MNPLLPDVLSLEKHADDAVTLHLLVPANLHYFPHHFANHPILPGVVQVNWAIHFGRMHLPIAGKFSRMENIKFQAVVFPDTTMSLDLKWNIEKQFLEFVFFDATRKFASGRIVFGTAS